MKKILLIAVTASLILGSCGKKADQANANDEDPTGSYGAGAVSPDAGHDSLNNPSKADSLGTDGYKADSVTQTDPIPR